MKKVSIYWILAGAAVVAWWFLKGKAQTKEVSPVEIDALASNVSQGLGADEEVGLFDRLFGIRDASRELVKLKSSINIGQRIKICHSDGTCELQSRGVIGTIEPYPLKAPKYFLDYLGVTP
mgnify:FL=1